MIINKKKENGSAILRPEGRLDTVTATELEGAVTDLLPELTELTFDFEKLTYISSAGLRVILSAQKKMDAASGKMKLINVSEAVMDILEVTGFTDILTIE